MRIAATLAIVVAGLVLVRWLAAVTASSVAAPPARSASASGDLPSIRAPAPFEPTPEPAEDIDTAAAHDEAMRLAEEALVDDDLETARDFYFLASEAVPGDPEAEARVRQVETVLGITDRTTAWREALDDVEELIALAPRAQSVVRAYTEALVGAGREALTQGNMLRALRLCGEATQRAPGRNDARLCAAQASATATAIPQATPLATPLAIPTAIPQPLPTATALASSQVAPTVTATSIATAIETPQAAPSPTPPLATDRPQ